MEFKREFFIKDLYNLKEIYGSFGELEFENSNSFVSHIEKEFIFDEQTYSVHLNDTEDVIRLLSLLHSTNKFEKSVIKMIPESIEVLNDIINATESGFDVKKTVLGLNIELAEYLVDVIGGEPKYCLENTTCLISVYKADDFFPTYKRDMALLLRAHYQRMRYDLKFDYSSFEAFPLSTLHLLRFVCNQIFIFGQTGLNTELTCVDEEYTRKSGDRFIKNLFSENALKGFLDDDGNIFLDKEKTVCYLKDPQEYKDQFELAKIRSLIDVKFSTEDSPLNNYLIDINQNLIVMKDIYVPPYLSVMVDRWLRGVEL